MVYKYQFLSYPVEAQAAGEEIERIINDCGGADPETVVERSRAEDSVLHPCFEWNDGIAGEQWRKQQARTLISQIVRVSVSDEVPDTRAFVSIDRRTEAKESTEKRYISIEKAMSDHDYREQVLNNAMKELRSFRDKYRHLKEFERLFVEIDATVGERAENG